MSREGCAGGGSRPAQPPPVPDPKKRAVGFKLAKGMEVPRELQDKFKFARQKSKLAGTIRGSYFVIKGEY